MKTGDSVDVCDNFEDAPSEEVKAPSTAKKQKVIVEKAEATGLPPGWIKEIKVTTKGRKIRRDPYYTDPISGYVFRSMKDAHRYLETGELGKLAFRPKEKGDNDAEFEDEKSSAASKKQKLAVDGTSPCISHQSSKLHDVAKDGDVGCTSTGESTPLSKHSSGALEDQINSSELSIDKVSGQTVEKSDPAKNVVATALGVLPHKHPMDSSVIKDECKIRGPSKSKKKKDVDLPRRASKRLAGLPLDPTPELKTANRTRKAALKQSEDAVARTESSSHPKHDSKHEDAVLPTNNIMNKQAAGKIETAKFADEKLGLPLALPIGDLWQDPCIAFAIKTLTGSFDNSESVQASSGSNNSEFGGTSTSEHTRKDSAQNVSQTKQGCVGSWSLGNTTIPEEQAGDTEVSDKGDEKPGSPLNLPFGDAWADPCIEFAIKTLTGAIPLDCDMIMQDCVQQKASSSQSQDSRSLTSRNVSDPNQSQFFCQQFGISNKSLYNQEAFAPVKNMNSGSASQL